MTLKPSQAARDAAADYLIAYGAITAGSDLDRKVRAGGADTEAVVQAFARFERDILARAERPVMAEAWLIRKSRGGKLSIAAGYMFKTERAARAAAVRLTNRWWLCQAFPVASLAALPPAPSTPSEQS